MAETEEVSDEILCRELHEGNEAAFTVLYNRYWHLLFLHAHKMLADKDEAMDVVQEVFSQFWKNAGRIEIKGQLRVYLYVSVRHGVLRFIAKGKQHQRFMDFVDKSIVESTQDADRIVLFKEFEESIERAISSLPSRMKEIFLLSRMEGLTHKEIADALAISEHTVKTTISRSLKILRRQLPTMGFTLLQFYLNK